MQTAFRDASYHLCRSKSPDAFSLEPNEFLNATAFISGILVLEDAAGSLMLVVASHRFELADSLMAICDL